jgi:hypothetical protein
MVRPRAFQRAGDCGMLENHDKELNGAPSRGSHANCSHLAAVHLRRSRSREHLRVSNGGQILMVTEKSNVVDPRRILTIS